MSTVNRIGDCDLPVSSVVPLDLSLPDSDGIETFDRFRAASELPIVVLTDDDDAAHTRALLERGEQDDLVKGEISLAAIMRLLCQAIEHAGLVSEIQKARDQALVADHNQRAFLAAMSQREIRTPLNAILRARRELPGDCAPRGSARRTRAPAGEGGLRRSE